MNKYNNLKLMIMEKVNFSALGSKVLQALKTAGRVTVIAASLFVGFTAGEIYRSYKKGLSTSHMPTVQKIEITSVAINDRGELMIIDRGTGKYMLFDDQVGQSIFNQYASRIYVQKQSGSNQ
jgi:hypothetical protein